MIQFAENSMRDAVHELWRECFGDSDAYVDMYLSSHDISRHTLVFIDGVRPVSMLSMLPMTVVTPGGILPARYIYAVATKREYRGRGISSKMIRFAHQHMKAAGMKLAVIVPASTELYRFYEKLGFSTAFYSGRAVVRAADIKAYDGSFAINDATEQEFMNIRESAFGQRTMFVRWDGDALSYRMTETAFYGGETLTIRAQDSCAIAVCRREGSAVVVKELALHNMKAELAISLLHHKYGADEYKLTLPMDLDCPYELQRVPSGAACWYDSDARERVGEAASRSGAAYMSLVLD